MKYVSVSITASKKLYAKLKRDAYSNNDLLVEKGTICEIKKSGNHDITLLSIDDEIIVIKNEVIDSYIELL